MHFVGRSIYLQAKELYSIGQVRDRKQRRDNVTSDTFEVIHTTFKQFVADGVGDASNDTESETEGWLSF